MRFLDLKTGQEPGKILQKWANTWWHWPKNGEKNINNNNKKLPHRTIDAHQNYIGIICVSLFKFIVTLCTYCWKYGFVVGLNTFSPKQPRATIQFWVCNKMETKDTQKKRKKFNLKLIIHVFLSLYVYTIFIQLAN